MESPLKPQVSSGSIEGRQVFRIHAAIYPGLGVGYSGTESDLLVHPTDYIEVHTRRVPISYACCRVGCKV